MSTRLIVNADDYGHTPGVSAWIRKAHMEGIVSTTTTMMNHADAVPALEIAREECPRLGVGVHLIMTEGHPVRPVETVSTLVQPTGTFYNTRELTQYVPQMDPAQLRDEFRAQIEKFLATGATLDHLDSHHHAVYGYDKTLQIVFDLAEEYGVPIRHPFAGYSRCYWNGAFDEQLATTFRSFAIPLMDSGRVRYPDHVNCDFYDTMATIDNLLSILDALPDGSTHELMVHPGITDDEIMRMSSYNAMRQQELAVLTDPRAKAKLDERGIQLITFREL
jgi:predicted glycoside hydrolase/deacetylase ChbG (UPF0249 family)